MQLRLERLGGSPRRITGTAQLLGEGDGLLRRRQDLGQVGERVVVRPDAPASQLGEPTDPGQHVREVVRQTIDLSLRHLHSVGGTGGHDR